MPLSRRELLGAALASPLLGSLSGPARADASAVEREMRRAMLARNGWPTALWLRRASGEEVFADFRRQDGGWLDSGLLTLSWFMRDNRDGSAVTISPRLFDLLAHVQTSLSMIHGSPLPMVLTSGYRSLRTNAATEGAARNSMHLYGYAADIRVHPFAPSAVAVAGARFAGGGIGLYDSFTHLDVARPRFWRGASAKSDAS